MNLHQQLQSKTKFLHIKIERSSILKKLTSAQITLTEYRSIIIKFYGFIAPCEVLINLHSDQFKRLIVEREKTSLLEQDLLALCAVDNRDYSRIPHCDLLPPLTDASQVLGYLYVMEGATLGAQIIAPILAQHLRVTKDNGGNFFYGYGAKTKTMWDKFCYKLNNIHKPSQQEKVILSARLTYEALYQWMQLE